MINPINFRELSNKEYQELGNEILSTLEVKHYKILRFAPLLNNLRTALRLLNRMMQLDATSAYEGNISWAAEQRDQAYLALYNYITACNHRLIEKWKIPSDLLLATLKPVHWKFQTENYTERNQILLKLMDEMQNNQEHAAALAAIEATDWVIELHHSLVQYEIMQKNRKEQLDEEVKVKPDFARNALQKAIENIFNYIELIQKIQQNSSCKKIADQINQIIAKTNQKIQNRKSQQENALMEHSLPK